MKKTLKYISIPCIAATIAVISVIIPYAYAQGDIGPVQGQLEIESGSGGCVWTGTPGAFTSDLWVPDGEICIITAANWAASDVTVDADVSFGGGTLIIGSPSDDVTFTIYDSFINEGTTEIGNGTTHDYDALLATNTANVNVQNNGSLTTLSNTATGWNYIEIDGTLQVGTSSDSTGTVILNDKITGYSPPKGVATNLTIYGSMTTDTDFEVYNTTRVFNDGSLITGSANTDISFRTVYLELGDSGTSTPGGTITNKIPFYIDTSDDTTEIYAGYFENNGSGIVSVGWPGPYLQNLTISGTTSDHGIFENNSASTTALRFDNLTVNQYGELNQNAGQVGGTNYIGSVITVFSGGAINIASGAVINTAYIYNLGDSGNNGGDITNYGTIANTSTFVINLYSDSLLDNFGAITTAGTINLVSGATTVLNNNSNSTITTTHLYTNAGTLNNYASESGKGLTVSAQTRVYNDGVFNNQGNLSTKELMIGNDATDPGGTLNNTGAGYITFPIVIGRNMQIYKGLLNNTSVTNGIVLSVVNNDSIKIKGDVSERGILRSSGKLTITGGATKVFDYGDLDLNNGTGADDSVATLQSLIIYGVTNDGEVNLESNTKLLTGSLTLGSLNANPKDAGNLINAGYIGNGGSKTVDPTASLTLNLHGGGTVTNSSGGVIKKYLGSIAAYSDGVFTNSSGAEVKSSLNYGAQNNSQTVNTDSVIINSGTWSDYYILLNAGTYTNNGTLTLTNGIIQVNAGLFTNSSGANLTTNYLSAAGQAGYATITSNGSMAVTTKIAAERSSEINLNINSPGGGSDIYNVGSVEIQSGNTALGTAKITVASGVTMNIAGTHTACAGTNICSLEVGYDDPGATPGTSELIINGTVNISETANDGRVEVSHLGRGTITLADNAVLNVDETGSVFYIRGDTSENATANIDGTMDIEMPLYVSGTMTVDTTDSTNATLNMVSNYTVTSTGKVNQGLLSTVTVEGSTTSISGDYGLDGTLDTGTGDGDSLTVTGTGHIFSRNSLSTNFKILAHDLTIESGGKIASDNKSEVDPGSQGSGSYGGAGEGRAATTSYGKTKLDINDAPLYGQAGATDSFGSIDAYGGGGVRIYSTGTITHSGEISADGMDSSDSGGGAGAGGTVILIHEPLSKDDDFTGSGVITANGGGSSTTGVPVGGGGRIVIDSILYDDPDAGSYGFDGTVSALPGANSTDADYAAAGTIAYTGDGHNSNDTLIVDQNNTLATSSEITSIPNTGTPAEFSFARVEARNGAKITYEADPVTDPVSCFEVGTGSDVNEGGFFTCNPYPDKPDTLYINDSWEGAQAGDGDEPANGAAISGLYDLTPVFSVVYRNPEDTAEVDKLKIQVDDSSNFASPLWDTTYDLGADSVAPGERTKDIEYAGTALSASTTYYVRMAFFDSTDTNQGLWTHRDIGDANGDYHYNFDIDGSMIINETCTGAIVIKDTTGGGNIRNVPGDRYGNDTCTIDVTSTYGYWSVLFGKQPGETAFEDSTLPIPNNIDEINNGGSDCTMDTNGSGTQEEYGYNIDTTLSAAVIQNHVENDGECLQDYDNSSYMFDVENEGVEDEIIRVNDNNTIDDSFVLTLHVSVNADTAEVTGYSLGVRAIITTPP